MLYEKIKKKCSEFGMSIAELERRAGLSNGSISKWGQCMPKADSLHNVAKLLETTVDELLGD